MNFRPISLQLEVGSKPHVENLARLVPPDEGLRKRKFLPRIQPQFNKINKLDLGLQNCFVPYEFSIYFLPMPFELTSKIYIYLVFRFYEGLFFHNIYFVVFFNLTFSSFSDTLMEGQVDKNEHFWHLLLFTFNQDSKLLKLFETFVLCPAKALLQKELHRKGICMLQ